MGSSSAHGQCGCEVHAQVWCDVNSCSRCSKTEARSNVKSVTIVMLDLFSFPMLDVLLSEHRVARSMSTCFHDGIVHAQDTGHVESVGRNRRLSVVPRRLGAISIQKMRIFGALHSAECVLEDYGNVDSG